MGVSGVGTFTQSGGTNTTNTVTLGNGSTGNGTYILSGGTLITDKISGAAGTSTFAFNGGVLQVQSVASMLVGGLTSAKVQMGGAIIDAPTNTDTITQPLLHDAALGATLDGGLTKMDAGTLALSGASTYTGPTTVSAGTLKAGVASVANTSGPFGNNSAVTMANVSGAILDITGFNTQIGSLTGGGATGGNVTLGAATLTVGADNTSPAAYAGAISGTGGALVKIGTGLLTLSGANTYTGSTSVNAGILNSTTFANINTASGIGQGSVGGSAADLVFGGGILQVHHRGAGFDEPALHPRRRRRPYGHDRFLCQRSRQHVELHRHGRNRFRRLGCAHLDAHRHEHGPQHFRPGAGQRDGRPHQIGQVRRRHMGSRPHQHLRLHRRDHGQRRHAGLAQYSRQADLRHHYRRLRSHARPRRGYLRRLLYLRQRRFALRGHPGPGDE